MSKFILQRRGFELGEVTRDSEQPDDPNENWQQGKPVFRHGLCVEVLEQHKAHIHQSEELVRHTLEGQSIDDFLHQPPYLPRFETEFESLGSAFIEGNEQEIEMVMFDAIDGDNTIAEDLWLKASWLSFYEDDASLRFRFSFGVDLEEDVALDPERQDLAGKLSDAIFPESAVITDNDSLLNTIRDVTELSSPRFVERIIYFNAPNGGAYLHHDLERGHAGVVYAQLTGSTCWLALPKDTLLTEINTFIDNSPENLAKEFSPTLLKLRQSNEQLEEALDSFNNDALINLINENEHFVQHLIQKGHARILQAGDVILLPQATKESCCWHSVFCLGDQMGQALSFAIR